MLQRSQKVYLFEDNFTTDIPIGASVNTSCSVGVQIFAVSARPAHILKSTLCAFRIVYLIISNAAGTVAGIHLVALLPGGGSIFSDGRSKEEIWYGSGRDCRALG